MNTPPRSDTPDPAAACTTALSAAWKNQPRYVVLDDGFDGGLRFLRYLQAWRADPQRCARLHVITVSSTLSQMGPHPTLAAELGTPWPPITANLHRLSFDGGQVQWLLLPSDGLAGLRELSGPIDAFLLGAGPADDAQTSATNARWQAKALARLARPGSLLWVEAASAIDHHALRSAGFSPCDGNGPRWRYAPSFTPKRAPQTTRPATDTPVVVIGAGLAGCAMAWALAEQGQDSLVLERHDAVAMEASGNPAGLFHGIVNPQDGAHARFNRAAALEAQRAVSVAMAQHGVAGSTEGLLRLESAHGDEHLATMQHTLQRLALPARYVQALSAHEASARSGWALPCPAWWYPGGGWVHPAGLARAFMARAGQRTVLRTGSGVETLTREGHHWLLHDKQGQLLARADTVVLANAGDALRLLRPLRPVDAPEAWPLIKQRGQLSMAALQDIGTLTLPPVPMAGAGYLLPPVDGMAIFGATSQPGDDDPSVRDSDHRHNLAQLSRLTRTTQQIDPTRLQGRTGWRWSTDDRLPLLGPVPDEVAAKGLSRLEHPAQVPRLPGLYACTAFGSRGITWAALSAQVVAASVTGAPMPIEASLWGSVDAARFVVRAATRRPPLDHGPAAASV